MPGIPAVLERALMLHELDALTLPPALEAVARESRSVSWYRDDITNGRVGQSLTGFQGYRFSPERAILEERLRETLLDENVTKFADRTSYGAVVRDLLSLHTGPDETSRQQCIDQLRSVALQAAGLEASHPEVTVLLLLAAKAASGDDGLSLLRTALDRIAPVATALRPTLDTVEAIFGVAFDKPGTPNRRGALVPQVIEVTDALTERLSDRAFLPFLAYVGVECRSWLALTQALAGNLDAVWTIVDSVVQILGSLSADVISAGYDRGWRMPGSGYWCWPHWIGTSLERIADSYLLLGQYEEARGLLSSLVDDDSVGVRMYTRTMERLGLGDQ